MSATDTLAVFRQPMPEALVRLRTAMLTAGCTATSEPELDDEDRRLIREEGQS